MKYLFSILCIVLLFSCTPNKYLKIKSPDKKTQVEFALNDKYQPTYTVTFNGQKVLLPSNLGFKIGKSEWLGQNMELSIIHPSENSETWKPVYGEKKEIENNYRQLKVMLTERTKPHHQIELTFRAYNNAIAFNTTFLTHSGEDSIVISDELTEFRFAENFECWVSNRAQSEITKRNINSLDLPVERPLVVETGKSFAAVAEAKLVDFARMKLISGTTKNSLKAELTGTAKVALPYTTPWRVILLGNSAAELLENNDVLLSLNDVCAIENTKWIQPGKVIREVTLTTQGGLACVDFAAENGLQYVEFDAGWYGPEGDWNSDATTITVDPKRSAGPLDLHRVIEYGKSKNIGVIVYVNRRALEQQLDTILPLYKSWGIKGVKYGFVQVGPQKWTRWLHEAVKKAADNQLMVDIHDEYRPTGFSRTYPNLMTQEGIRGDEESPTNEHTLKTLFTRMLAGAADNTNCYFAPRVQEKMGGNVSQLAKAVMLYSPWQFLYWYDRPQKSPGKKGGAGNSTGYIQNLPELDFFKNLPTVWDDTKVIEGEIGRFATIVRCSGNNWYLGSLTANEKHHLLLNTSFLNKTKSYKAEIFYFDKTIDSPSKVNRKEISVKPGKTLEFDIDANSGLAARFIAIDE